MKKGTLLALPLLMMFPLILLMLGAGNANIEAVQTGCANTATSGSAGGAFGIGTLSWGGASHEEKNPRPGERPDAERVPSMVSKIGASGASIIGFQEFETPQAQAFLKTTHGAWAIVAGKAHGKRATANSIAYQPAAWKADEVRYVSINYGGPIVQIPLVRFTSTSDLGSVWVLNTHHPANAIGGTDAMRDSAVRAEAEALRQLQATEPNTPLFLTGDMNDQARFKRLFLSLAGPGWSSANPSDQQIDWIMGGPGTSFSGTVVDQSTHDMAHHYTEHPFVHTTGQLHGSATGQAGTGQAGTGRSGTGTDLGVMPTNIKASPGGPVNGHILVANANIKTRAGFTPGVRALTGAQPDFITLNEVSDVPISQMRSSAPGYDAYRDPAVLHAPDAGEASLGNAIMWRTDTWTMLDGGRVRITLEDHVIFKGQNKNWGRWAAWGVFQRTDGAVVSVISTHQMTNPFRFPHAQWGNQPFTRAEQYGQGMDYLVQLAQQLSAYGLVLVGGDMNSHPGEGPNSAVEKMQAAGYLYTKDSGVIYNFYASPVQVDRTWQISSAAVHSDHPALFTRMSMNGADPGASTDTTSPGCPPCQTTADITNVANTGCPSPPMTEAGQLSAALSARVNAMRNTPNGLCGLSWTQGAPCTYDNQCSKVVDALYGGPGVGRGYGDGEDVAQGIVSAGLAQTHGTGLDPLPPVGAVVSYNTGNGVGHVAIYVGNGKIFGNDYGCSANGVYGCVGFADVHAPGGSVTWALPKQAFDMGGMPSAAA